MSTDDMPSDLGFHVRSQFKLIWRRSFAHPIHQVWYGDLTHDGLSELAVISMGGVHILQVSCFRFYDMIGLLPMFVKFQYQFVKFICTAEFGISCLK